MAGHPRPIDLRFFSKVSPETHPGGCWLWTGSASGHGYGQIYDSGRLRVATRVSWEIRNSRPFPENMDACHRCDNPPCVNPAHIFPGTISDNARDSLSKGRHFKAAMVGCREGHDFTPANTYRRHGTGSRQCRACRAAHNRKRRAIRRLKTVTHPTDGE